MARAQRKTGLLGSIFSRKDSDGESFGLELVVLEGPDAGARFALDRPEIQLGRGDPNGTDILLNDHSVSLKHAIFSVDGQRVMLRHLPTATNPTLVNGRAIKSRQVKAGDEIVMGLVVMELRTRTGASVGDSVPPEAIATTRILDPDAIGAEPPPLEPGPTPEPTPEPTSEPTRMMRPPGESTPEPTRVMSPPAEPGTSGDPDTTQIVAPEVAATEAPAGTGRLMLTGGIAEWKGKRFELNSRRTGIGRSDDCDIAVPISSVSRHHAALLWEGSELILVHESNVNPTYVNDTRVDGRTPLAHGDQIRLTDGVTFYLILDPPAETEGYQTLPDLDPGPDQTVAETSIAEAAAMSTPDEPAGTVVMAGSNVNAEGDAERKEQPSRHR
jgi:pSer/pThr/pTyr-binding forkhead associated (FHA) protein